MLIVTVFVKKKMLMKDMMLSSSNITKAVSMTAATNLNGPNYSLEEVPHHTDVSGKLITWSSIMFPSSVVQLTQLN
jgi:hypothetical protein